MYDPDYGRGRGPAARLADRLITYTTGEPPDHTRVVVWDLADRREVARVPGRSARFSPDGRWLATADGAGVVRVWGVPTRTPWDRILACAVVAAAGTGLAVLGLARLIRRWWRGWLGRGFAWARRRWRPVRGLAAVVACFAGVVVWDQLEKARERAALVAVYEAVNATRGLTEAEVTSLAGGPPDVGPVAPISGRKRGGGSLGEPVTLRKWTRRGTELDIEFGTDGRVRSVYISDPLPLNERVAGWLGI